ncbi:hypothetical protein N7532_007901 [Penicillium argentinense]|uniref:Uncharacterized protein n=1 Tax=Penicillium argentinense TaxID=1131581 RepID=A0A9W9EWC3_9EURO|nr:uncharacterized protein N7532_007901 [Penicillium argentinense]KAJ5089217.1 hypothetical protein N7532_007901 [Penicillium argentinense]
MARQSRELGFDPSTPFAEENPDLWQPSSFLGLFGDPTPVSQTEDHQRLHVGYPLRHDSFFEGFSTTAGPGWAAPTSTLENNPFTINHDAFEPWLRAPTSSARDILCYERGAVDSTDPKEPTQPAKRSPNPTRGGKRRVKKKTSSGHQHSSRPE